MYMEKSYNQRLQLLKKKKKKKKKKKTYSDMNVGVVLFCFLPCFAVVFFCLKKKNVGRPNKYSRMIVNKSKVKGKGDGGWNP